MSTYKRISCKCGRRMKLKKPDGTTFEGSTNKTHKHCSTCKLEWHWNGGRIYAHPYNPHISRKDNYANRDKKTHRIIIQTRNEEERVRPSFPVSFSFIDIARIKE